MAEQIVKIAVPADVHKEQITTSISAVTEQGTDLLVTADVYNEQSSPATSTVEEKVANVLVTSGVCNEPPETNTLRRSLVSLAFCNKKQAPARSSTNEHENSKNLSF